MSIEGTWDIVADTPMGAQQSTITLSDDGGTLTGTSESGGQEAEIYDGTSDGNTGTWKVDLTQPLPMTLTFTAEVDGDNIKGEADPGMFPPSPFTGTRQS